MTKNQKQLLFKKSLQLVNYINVSDHIKTIPYCRYRYDFILSCSKIKVGEVEDNVVDVDEDGSVSFDDYLLCTIGDRSHTLMTDFFDSCNQRKILIYHLVEWFSDIVDSLILLKKANICWFDFTPNSIRLGNGLKPILSHFENSILLDNNFSITLKEILKNIHDFKYKPIEVHLVYYLLMNNETIVSLESVENVKTNFARMSRLEVGKLCYLDKYVGYSIEQVISEMNPGDWDSYIFCSIYIDLLRHIDSEMFPKNEVITDFILTLSTCNDIDPENRATLDELQECCYQVKQNCKKWGFVDYFL
jgi:hypothetical protein